MLSRNVLNGKRGSQGVAITLSREGVIVWKAAGSELHIDFGAEIIAIRLVFFSCPHSLQLVTHQMMFGKSILIN